MTRDEPTLVKKLDSSLEFIREVHALPHRGVKEKLGRVIAGNADPPNLANSVNVVPLDKTAG